MSEKPISPLRLRMTEDMTMRNFIEKTRNDYIRHVLSLTAFLRRSPDTATPEDLRRFQLHQTQTGVRAPNINAAVAGIRFFVTVTLDRPDMARHLTFVREPRKMPAVLSSDEVVHLLKATPGPKYKAALGVAYGAGLRVSEVVSLKISDVNSKRMLLKVEQGKGRKDRLAMLSPQPLELLRDWYRIVRPPVWLFPDFSRDCRRSNKTAPRYCSNVGTQLTVTPNPMQIATEVGQHSGAQFSARGRNCQRRRRPIRCRQTCAVLDPSTANNSVLLTCSRWQQAIKSDEAGVTAEDVMEPCAELGTLPGCWCDAVVFSDRRRAARSANAQAAGRHAGGR